MIIKEISEEKYPIIWKKEDCLLGECADGKKFHRWSIPFSAASGLVVECYNCQKLKDIYIEQFQEKQLEGGKC